MPKSTLALATCHNTKVLAQSLGLPMVTLGDQYGGRNKVIEFDGPLYPPVKKSKFKKRKRK